MYKHRRLIKLLFILFFLVVIMLARLFTQDDAKDDGDTFVSVEEEAPPAVETPAPEKPPEEKKPEEPVQLREILKEILDLRQLYGNDDIVGHILIAGTTIDYPVVQYADNEFYLERNIYKQPDRAGSIFLDYENSLDAFDKNTIIYGHNMRANEMFHALRYYRDEAFFKDHPQIIYTSLYEKTLWDVFSFMKAPVSLNYLQVNPAPAKFALLLDDITKLSMYDTGVEVTRYDKILNLSTCSVDPAEEMYRYVLSAKFSKVLE